MNPLIPAKQLQNEKVSFKGYAKNMSENNTAYRNNQKFPKGKKNSTLQPTTVPATVILKVNMSIY